MISSKIKIVAVIITSLLICFNLVHSKEHVFIEDFSTLDNCDISATTAWWDTGSGMLTLYPFAVSVKGHVNTYGDCWNLVVAGNYLYVADGGRGIDVVDITDPESPSVVGRYNTAGSAVNITLHGDYAFVADFGTGVLVLDITDPTNPILIDSLFTSSSAHFVEIQGDRGYVANYDSTFMVLDISEPANLVILGEVTTPGYPLHIAVEGNYAFVADNNAGLTVIDVTNDSAPSVVTNFVTGGARRVWISGDYAFVANDYNGMVILDITDPTNPSLISSFNTPGRVLDLELVGDHLYICDNSNGFLVMDISDPDNPSLVSTHSTSGNAMGLASHGEYMFVSCYGAGVDVFKVAEVADLPQQIDFIELEYIQTFTEGKGDICYAFNNSIPNMYILGVNDPAHPEILSTISISFGVADAIMTGDYLYMATSTGLAVYDIYNPNIPSFVGSYGPQCNATGIAISGRILLITDWSGYVYIFDIGNPINPVLISSKMISPDLTDIEINGDIALISDRGLDGSDNLFLLDISNPVDPKIRSSFGIIGDYTYNTAKLELSGNHVFLVGCTTGFLAGGKNQDVLAFAPGLQIVDISDTYSPFLKGSITPPPGCFIDLRWDGDHLFCINYDRGVDIIDITNVSTPYISAYYYKNGSYWEGGMTHVDDYLYVGDHYFDGESSHAGIFIYQIYDRDKFLMCRSNLAQSSTLALGDSILAIRMLMEYEGTVGWEISLNDGINWSDAEEGEWIQTANMDAILCKWRAKLEYENEIPPQCSNVEIQWLYEYAVIDSITDIGNDQGGNVRISWSKSAHDFPNDTLYVTSYSVLRFNGGWETICTVPAHCEDKYSVIVPTLADYEEGEDYHTLYLIRAETNDQGKFFDSYPDSGYSVDNLEPPAPSGLMVEYNLPDGNRLSWYECEAPDLDCYRIYRSDDEAFTPSQGNLVYSTLETTWLDDCGYGSEVYYKISAVDKVGNESQAVQPETVSGKDTPDIPRSLKLYQNVPNPFNPSTVIKFDLPLASHVKLEIFDVTGRLVEKLVDDYLSPGEKIILWEGRDDENDAVSSGIYFYRLSVGTEIKTRKMVLIR